MYYIMYNQSTGCRLTLVCTTFQCLFETHIKPTECFIVTVLSIIEFVFYSW